MLDAWRDWPSGKLLLIGAAGAGKTHLAHVWAEMAGAVLFDPAQEQGLIGQNCVVDGLETLVGDHAREERLFHLHNHLQSAGHALLVTSAVEPARLTFALPDLQSRMMGTQLVRIEGPDEALIAGVMAKLFDDRQLIVAPPVISYAATRLPRTLAAVHQLVGAVDALALERAKPVTRALMAEVLDTLPLSPDDVS